jgi:GAF domain-containing protein
MLEMTSMLMLHREVETIFGEVMKNTRKLISADRATLFLLDAENTELYSHVSKNVPEIRIPLSHGIVGYSATHKEVVLIPDAYMDNRFDKQVDQRSGYRTRSVVCVPLLTRQGVLLGVIEAINKTDGNYNEVMNTAVHIERKDSEFSYTDSSVLKSFASQVAHAVLNCKKIFNEVVEKRNLERTLIYFKDRLEVSDNEKLFHSLLSERRYSLMVLAADISSVNSLPQACIRLVRKLCVLFDTEFAQCFVYDPKEKQFYYYQSNSETGGHRKRYTNLGVDEISAWRSEVILNSSMDEFNKTVLKSVQNVCCETFSNILAVPSNFEFFEGELMIILGNKKTSKFSEDDEFSCKLLANVIRANFEKLSIFETIKHITEQLHNHLPTEMSVADLNSYSYKDIQQNVYNALLLSKEKQALLDQANHNAKSKADELRNLLADVEEERAKIVQRHKVQINQLVLLNELQIRILNAKDLAHLAEILENGLTGSVLLAEKRILHLYHPIENEIERVSVSSLQGKKIRSALGTLEGLAAMSSSIINLEDVQKHKLYDGLRDKRGEMKQMLCTPVFDKSDKKVIGVLQLINKPKGQGSKFSEADEDQATALSVAIGTTIDRIGNLALSMKKIEEEHDKAIAILSSENKTLEKKFSKTKMEKESLSKSLQESQGVIEELEQKHEAENKAKIESQSKLTAAEGKCREDINAMKIKFQKSFDRGPSGEKVLNDTGVQTSSQDDVLMKKIHMFRSVVYQLIGLNKLEMDQFSVLEQLHSPEKYGKKGDTKSSKESLPPTPTKSEMYVSAFVSGETNLDNHSIKKVSEPDPGGFSSPRVGFM